MLRLAPLPREMPSKPLDRPHGRTPGRPFIAVTTVIDSCRSIARPPRRTLLFIISVRVTAFTTDREGLFFGMQTPRETEKHHTQHNKINRRNAVLLY